MWNASGEIGVSHNMSVHERASMGTEVAHWPHNFFLCLILEAVWC